MHRANLPMLVLIGVLSACSGSGPQQTTPPTTDTDTSEPKVLPIDTSVFIPQDTSPNTPPNLDPSHWVYMVQQGVWNLSPATPPYTDVSGTLRIQEYVDDLDTALPVYECNVVYSLTGSAVNYHDCAACDFVFEVEHYVQQGDTSGCHDPDVPVDGSVWWLGFDSGTNKIFMNYFGTGVWLPWYDATRVGATIDFNWNTTLAIEVEDTGDN